MKSFIFLFVILFFAFNSGCNGQYNDFVRTGADMLLSAPNRFVKGAKLGIVTNHTAILRDGSHLVDSLIKIDGVCITALFGPEHGIRGDNADGKIISHGKDQKTGIPVFSLYGENRKPTPEMLENIDILIFDIQDVGARFYTYISTLYYAIEAASENHKKIIILDRPNPIGGIQVEGPVLEDAHRSFVGITKLPIRHGMTVGELSLYFKDEIEIKTGNKTELIVIRMEGWKRDYYFDQCGLPWVKPSPNMTDIETAIVYPGLCLIEGTNISEGRGTNTPFLKIGAPYIKSSDLISSLNNFKNDGLEYLPAEFIPEEIPGMAVNPKYKSQRCYGIEIVIKDRKQFRPVELGVKIISTIAKLYPNDFLFRENSIIRLYGSRGLSDSVREQDSPESIFKSWDQGLIYFNELRRKYLIYE